jgi:hypothetical protein
MPDSKETFQGTKQIWRGATRVLWSQDYDQYDYLEIPDVMDLGGSYDALDPWKDYGASKMGPSVTTEKIRHKTTNYLTIPIAEKAPHNVDPFKTFSLVLITQAANEKLTAWHVKGCRIKKLSYPEQMHEQVSIVVEIYFDTLECLESVHMYQEANT